MFNKKLLNKSFIKSLLEEYIKVRDLSYYQIEDLENLNKKNEIKVVEEKVDTNEGKASFNLIVGEEDDEEFEISNNSENNGDSDCSDISKDDIHEFHAELIFLENSSSLNLNLF